MQKLIIQKLFSYQIIIGMLLIFGCLIYPKQAIAGGIYINEKSLFFNRKHDERTFPPDKPIQMEFQYDGFAYAGKPYIYAIFEIYQILPNSQEKLIGYVPALLEKSGNKGTAQFDLPIENSTFLIKYHVVPYFSNQMLTSSKYGGYLNKADIRLVKSFYRSGNAPYLSKLTIVKTGPKMKRYVPKEDITIKFVNPTKVEEELNAGHPLTFIWRTDKSSSLRAKNVKFSYRLDPIEDWSIYSTSKTVTYNFLRPGNYTFMVKAEFYINDNDRKESSVASWTFTVKKQIFGLSKKELLDKVSVTLPQEFFDSIKSNNSRALIIGVTNYQDSVHFVNLPYIKKDIRKLTLALKKRGFKITIMNQPPTKINIERILDKFYKQSKVNDQVIVYFSGHGTSIGDQAYFVSSDCMHSHKKRTCISLEYLKKWIRKMMAEKHVKHLLVIMDSCQSGLGVLSKSEKSPPITELARYPSAHMLTAGLAEQEAYIDNRTGMSVFTKFLVKGLLGSADLTGDDVISLTELLVYVQNNVATYVSDNYQKMQTPVLGKINGAGELIFLLK